jgi:hypothetical protein
MLRFAVLMWVWLGTATQPATTKICPDALVSRSTSFGETRVVYGDRCICIAVPYMRMICRDHQRHRAGKRVLLRGGGGEGFNFSSSEMSAPDSLEEGEEWPSEFSSDMVDPKSGLKGELRPNSIQPIRMEDYSSEIDQWTQDAEKQAHANDEYEKERHERGILQPTFKASTLHDDSWEQEHLHLHPDRLVMHEDFPDTLVDIWHEKPFFRDLPAELLGNRRKMTQDRCTQVPSDIHNELELNEFEQDSSSVDEMWMDNLAWMHKLKDKEAKGKATGAYDAYCDIDEVDLGLDEKAYRRFEKLPPDHPDFGCGPDRATDEEYLERFKAFRYMHDRPYMDKLIRELERADGSKRRQASSCLSAVAAFNMRGRQLQVAARCGQVHKIRELVAAGVAVNFRDIVRDTPLHWAAFNGQVKAVKALIELGADLNLRTEKGAHLRPSCCSPTPFFT